MTTDFFGISRLFEENVAAVERLLERSVGRPRASSGLVADIHGDGLDAPISPRVYFPLCRQA